MFASRRNPTFPTEKVNMAMKDRGTFQDQKPMKDEQRSHVSKSFILQVNIAYRS